MARGRSEDGRLPLQRLKGRSSYSVGKSLRSKSHREVIFWAPWQSHKLSSHRAHFHMGVRAHWLGGTWSVVVWSLQEFSKIFWKKLWFSCGNNSGFPVVQSAH